MLTTWRVFRVALLALVASVAQSAVVLAHDAGRGAHDVPGVTRALVASGVAFVICFALMVWGPGGARR